MTPTWLKYAIGVIVVATLAVAFSFRDDIFQTLQDPGVPFQTQVKPAAPEYSQRAAWMAWPDEPRDAAVFVLVPEVYKGSEFWNLPVDDERRRAKLERVVRPNYVEPYRSAGALYAPYYRQAALYAFLNNRKDSQSAQDLAYSDVRRAFDAFLADVAADTPIVIVGHGQGAAHAQRLLAERYASDLRGRLAVAYVIDHPMLSGTLGSLSVCATETQTDCVVSWNAVMDEEVRAKRLRQRALVPVNRRYESVAGREIVCTNPLSWRSDFARVEADAHLGGVGAEGFEPGVRPTVHARQVSAQCVDGLLQLSTPNVVSLRRPRKIGGRFRTLPSNLFYEDLRVNALRRVEAFRAAKGL